MALPDQAHRSFRSFPDSSADGRPSADARPKATSTERLRKGRTLAERRLERREALLDTALELFGTKGYAATSVEEICRTAFVSTRNFYEEFENREAVLFELGERQIADAYRAMVKAERADDPADRVGSNIRARVSTLVHNLLDDPRVARLAFIETLGVSPVQESRRREAHHLFARYFGQSGGAKLMDGRFVNRRQEVFSLALVGAINEVMSDWVLRDDKPPIEDLIDSIVEVIVMMYSALGH
jgi:AcrR family transcriptional regulator